MSKQLPRNLGHEPCHLDPTIKSFLNNRCQQNVLNGQSSVWKPVTAGGPQSSVLDPFSPHLY